MEGAVSELTLKDKTGAEIEKRLPGGKVKKKVKAEVVLETTTRSKKKCVTTIQGAHPSLSVHHLTLIVSVDSCLKWSETQLQ